MRPSGSPPRWRCARPDCPWHRWQVVTVRPGADPMDVAMKALEWHWAKKHKEPEPKGIK